MRSIQLISVCISVSAVFAALPQRQHHIFIDDPESANGKHHVEHKIDKII
jgi:hypothetical protein